MDDKDLISRSAVIKLIREMDGSYTPAAFAAKVAALFAGDAKMTGARELGADSAGVGCDADKEDCME